MTHDASESPDMPHPILRAAEAATGIQLAHSGELGLLDRPRRMLLVSRGERNPQPDTPWLINVIDAARRAAEAGEVLVSALGRIPYEASVWTAARQGGAAVLVLEASLNAADPRLSILPDPDRRLLIWPASPLNARDAPQRRDALIAALCDRAYAIRIRNGGNMARIAASLAARGVPVEKYGNEVKEQRPNVRRAQASPETLHDVQIPADWDYLTHFTREPDGPFPGETRSDYLSWLCSGPAAERRDAFAALRRILKQRRVAGCGRLISGGAPMVCLTALHPMLAKSLRCWRKGLLRWSFTPYGLAIRRGAAQKLGAKPVRYVSQSGLRAANPDEQCYMQRDCAGEHDWSAESEWRIAAALDFAAVDANDLLVCVATPTEEAEITRTFQLRGLVLGA